MKAIFRLFAVAVFVSAAVLAQATTPVELKVKTASLEGKVVDMESGEMLAGVTVKVENLGKLSYSDFDGNFVISEMLPGTYELRVSYISYDEEVVSNVTVDVECNKPLEIKLKSSK